MNDKTEIFRAVAKWLSRTAGHPPSTITYDTEVYGELGIYGHDILELVLWARDEFGVYPDLKISDYVPGEVPFFWLVKFFRNKFGISDRQYKSLKVRDIIAAIEAKHWSQ